MNLDQHPTVVLAIILGLVVAGILTWWWSDLERRSNKMEVLTMPRATHPPLEDKPFGGGEEPIEPSVPEEEPLDLGDDEEEEEDDEELDDEDFEEDDEKD